MVQIVFPWSVYLFHCSKKVYVLVMLPNREISVTGTAPCSTGTGYSTNTVRWPSWYCPTFSLPIHFVPFFCQFMLRTFDVPLFTEWCDMMLLLFWWAGVRRCGDGFTMLLILSIAIVSPSKVLTLSVLQWTIALLSPPPYWCTQCGRSHWSPTHWQFYYWGCWQSFGGAKRSCYCILQWVDYPDECRQKYNTGNAIAIPWNITGMVSLPNTILVMLSPHFLPLPVQ